MSLRSKTLLVAGLTVIRPATGTAAGAEPPHNLILFVPDGLRALMVTPETAPTMAALRDKGVNFAQSAFAVPDLHHRQCLRPGDRPLSRRHRRLSATRSIPAIRSAAADGSVTPFLENDPVLGDVDEHFAGNYLDEETILQSRARPGLQHRRDRQARADPDLRPHRAHRRRTTIIVDDSTGTPGRHSAVGTR